MPTDLDGFATEHGYTSEAHLRRALVRGYADHAVLGHPATTSTDGSHIAPQTLSSSSPAAPASAAG